jgi:hypothetical protein
VKGKKPDLPGRALPDVRMPRWLRQRSPTAPRFLFDVFAR